MSICTCILSAVLLLQADTQTEQQLFNQLVNEQSQVMKVVLIDEFSKKYPQSELLDEVYTVAMNVFAVRGDASRTADYAERAIKVNPESIEALVNLSRQYAVEGRNLNRAIQYARRAVEIAENSRGKTPPPGYQVTAWKQYLVHMKATAEGTVKYIQAMTNAILGRRKGPG